MALHTQYMKPNIQVIYTNSQETQFILSPIEKGFGISFANILRRIILRYTPGVSVIGLKVRGIEYLHPYTKITGVKEDVTEILSNLRNLLIKTSKIDSLTMSIQKKGPCVVQAGHILHDEDTSILNHDLHICTLDVGSQLSMVIYGSVGYGFVPSTYYGAKKDVVYCDTVYSPIKHVSYHLRTYATYDEIIFNVQTNGTCNSFDAINNAFSFLNAKTNISIIA